MNQEPGTPVFDRNNIPIAPWYVLVFVKAFGNMHMTFDDMWRIQYYRLFGKVYVTDIMHAAPSFSAMRGKLMEATAVITRLTGDVNRLSRENEKLWDQLAP